MGDRPAPARHGIVPEQIAEIIVTLDGETGRRGSGYLVWPTAVLTAAHIVEGAVSVRVRFNADLPGEWVTEVISCWTDPRSDLAVLTIAQREGEPSVVVARFGRISGRAAVLAVQAVGSPRFKLRTDDGDRSVYRDSHQAVGSVAVLSNRREGTLEVTVPPPEQDPDPGVSPWEGMSGAAVWVGDRIVGVIAKHHRTDGLGRLGAARLDLALEGLDAIRRAELCALIGLPDVLPDVVPPSTGEQVTTAYQTQVRDIVPDRLLDREEELDELVGFCAGDQPYAWWQAGPWAGKSALMAWFVLHPPAGVDVVSFFITTRLAEQSDSSVCTTALIEQLAALVGESPAGLLTAGARRGTMLRLLEDAASRSREAGRRLLLVIDGLDEDSGTATGPSIAALLPRRPPPEVRVLVTSRPHPPLPDDVAGDHPLQTIIPRELAVSEHARDVERRAKLELTQLLTGSQLQRDVLGLIAAAGGGLAPGDLEEITEQLPFEIGLLLGGILGRSVGYRTREQAVGRAKERVYLFTHETLRLVAEQQYGNSLAAYRDRLNAWADTWRHRGWPANTPQYLLRSYPRMLASNGDLLRLVACATDHVRHDRMRDLTGGDALAFTEISTAQQLILAQPDPDLTSLAILAVQREHLTERNANIPLNLPALWAKLGQSTRAETLAHSIPDPDSRAESLTRLAEAVAASGDPYRAEALIAQITDPYWRAAMLSRLADTAAASGDPDRAPGLAREAANLIARITDQPWNWRALSQRDDDRTEEVLRWLAAALDSGDHDQAEALVPAITDPVSRERALVWLAMAVAAGGDLDRAEALIAQITDPTWRASELSWLAVAVAAGGDHDRAEALIAQITDPTWRESALSALADVVGMSGDHDRAEVLVAQITDPYYRTRALSQLAMAIARTNEKTSPVRDHPYGSSAMLVRARHLLGEALATGSWTDVALSLARIDPPAVGALADELQVRWKLNGPADPQGDRDS